MFGQETGVLFLREVNDKWGWFEDGNKDKDAKYIGEFKDGEKHGQGTSTYPVGDKYVGEYKDGKEHGQGTYTFPDGRKYVGEWKNKEKWNGLGYDKNGDFVVRFVNGEQQ